jgi:hypothetical protein
MQEPYGPDGPRKKMAPYSQVVSQQWVLESARVDFLAPSWGQPGGPDELGARLFSARSGVLSLRRFDLSNIEVLDRSHRERCAHLCQHFSQAVSPPWAIRLILVQ